MEFRKLGRSGLSLAPLSLNSWYDVAIHFRASGDDKGFYELFLNGKRVDSREGVSMIVPGRGYGYIKNGLYRNGPELDGPSEIHLDSARLGTTLASVSP